MWSDFNNLITFAFSDKLAEKGRAKLQTIPLHLIFVATLLLHYLGHGVEIPD